MWQVLLYELAALAPPFNGRNLLELSRLICAGTRLSPDPWILKPEH